MIAARIIGDLASPGVSGASGSQRQSTRGTSTSQFTVECGNKCIVDKKSTFFIDVIALNLKHLCLLLGVHASSFIRTF
jgi:hypothetical protein